MKKALRIAAMLLVIGALVCGAVLLVRRKRQQLRRTSKYGIRPRPVTVAVARQGKLTEKRHYLAVVEPSRRSVLAARVTAPVMKMHQDEGDVVKAGAVLVTLDSRETRHRIGAVDAQIEQVQAELDANRASAKAMEQSWAFWKAELTRAKDLARRGVTSLSELQRQKSLAAEAEGKLEAARKQCTAIRKRITALGQQRSELKTRLTYYSITSPYAGIVTRRLVEAGALASPQQPLMEVEDRSHLRLSFDVPQADIPAVKPGLPVRFVVQENARTARLSHLFPSLNRERMLRAEARLSGGKEKGLLPGAHVSVSVVLNERAGVTLVPTSSLIGSPQGGSHVFVVEKNRLSAQAVTLLGRVGDEVAVEGVQPGVRVVRNTFLGWARLASGEKVEAVP